MPSFGKKQKEESINDKMVRMFKEGMSVDEISKELEVKPDVITNVIRRRCGEDSIPETVIRSKNSIAPHNDDVQLKAESAVPAPTPEEAAKEAAEEEEATEGLSKLERMMREKEKKKREAEENAANEAAAREEPAPAAMDEAVPVAEEVSMDAVSMDDIDLSSLGTAESIIPEDLVYNDEESMAGISAEEIPDLNDATVIEEAPINAYSEPEVAVEEAAPAVETVVDAVEEIAAAAPAPAETVAFEVPAEMAGGSAFNKMKAFAQAQIAANNEKLAELESKLRVVEADYNGQLEEAEKTVEASKVKYEDVINRSDEINDKRIEIQTEHRAALARAEEDYRKRLAELDEEYNNATAHANKIFSEKEDEINKTSEAIDAEKEAAKNEFLENQSKVTELKDKIAVEVDSVKAQINSIKEENKGYESFVG